MSQWAALLMQGELQALKAQHASLMRIEKGRSSGPFPIRVTATVPQPPPHNFDCDSLQVMPPAVFKQSEGAQLVRT